MEVLLRRDESTTMQWSRARNILNDMKTRRASLEAGHSQRGILSQSSPGVTKLTTLDEYKTSETDRAREILDAMKQRREAFSKILVGASSPAASKRSWNTESTAALSWNSSFTGSEPEIFSEEGLSNCSYGDYSHFHDSEEEASSSDWSISTSESFSSEDNSSCESASLLSALTGQASIIELLREFKSVTVPNPVVSNPKLSGDREKILERKTTETSCARALYRDGGSEGSVRNHVESRRERTYQYLRRDSTVSKTSRLRADMAKITERRAMLTKMLETVPDLKAQEIDMASTILSLSLSCQSSDSNRPPRPTVSQQNAGSLPRLPLLPASPKPRDRIPHSRPNLSNAIPERKRVELLAPSLRTDVAKTFFGYWSDKKRQLSDHEFPISEKQLPSANQTTASLTDVIGWDDAASESLYLSDSRAGASDEDSLPRDIQVPMKEAPRKCVHFPVQDSHGGGLHRISQLAEKPSIPRSKIPRSLEYDYMIPYNVEERFCGGLYHIATLSTPQSNLAVI